MGFIYVIKNDINNKLYVGQTVTTILNRWYHHLDAYTREDWHLYRAMRKYGIEHFSIELLEECPNDIIDEREKYWINKLDTYYHGYNMTIGGEGRTALDRNKIIKLWNEGYSALQIANMVGNGWSCSIIDILKENDLYDAEEIQRRKIIDIANKQTKEKIIQYDENANVVNIFNSIKEASELTGINRKNIRTALDNHLAAGGYLWQKESELPPKPRKLKICKIRKVGQIDLKTNQIIHIYDNANAAAKATGACGSTITKVCRGERHKHHNFGWCYLEEEN